MRATLDVDEPLVEAVVEATGEKSKSKAVNNALKAYLRREAIYELRAMAGKIPIDDLREAQRAADRRWQDVLGGLRGE